MDQTVTYHLYGYDGLYLASVDLPVTSRQPDCATLDAPAGAAENQRYRRSGNTWLIEDIEVEPAQMEMF